MPFTFSHPALVLPFGYLPRRWVSMTGLIIGSMAPDFEKFIRMSPYDAYSHTWRSIFYFNLPISIVAAFLFHLIIRDVLIDHLPDFLKTRLTRYKGFNWTAYFKKRYSIVVLSVLVGVVSHIGWDAMTHADGRFVRMFPALAQEISINHVRITIFNLLQNGFSLLGILVVLYAYLTLPTKPIYGSKVPWYRILSYWSVFLLISLGIIILRFLSGSDPGKTMYLIVTTIAAGLLSLLLTSILFRITKSLS